jgi:hypothetical protein
VVPQPHQREEVRALDREPAVHLVGGSAGLGRAFARILDRQRGGDDHHLAHAAVALRLQHHPAEAGIDRQPGESPADRRQPAGTRAGRDAGLGREGRAELLQQRVPVADRAVVRRLDEREGGDVAEADRGHLQDDRGEVGAQDLGFGERGSRLEVLLAVQPDADAGGDPSAPAGPLVRGCLRHRLDRQPLHLQPEAVPRDARRPRVDDVPDPGNRQ